MATKSKTKTTKTVKAESGMRSLHQLVRDQRKSVVETKMEMKLGRLKNTSTLGKKKKEVARTLTKLNASRIIASLKK